MLATEVPALCNTIRYSDRGSYLWLWEQAPFVWKGNVNLYFATVPIGSLQPAGCLFDPAVVAAHRSSICRGRAIAPLVVCANGVGGWYIHDGNHRYRAFCDLFAGSDEAEVRIAIVVPNAAFRFVYRWFGTYGTYRLEPAPLTMSASTPLPFNGRTMVLVPHQDDETACAGLLQRLTNPIITFATDGAPADEHFWRRHGSRANYAKVRRNEAQNSVAKVKGAHPEFLKDHAAGVEFRDQQLYRVLPEAFETVSGLVRRHRADVLLVPAYEGGHPDHDSCSFLGAMLRRRFGLPVWEMPLYHRSKTGELVCQQFLAYRGTEHAVTLNTAEKQLREEMIAVYTSQADVRDYVSAGAELFRPQADYDYSSPPHPGTLNYEAWQWPISAKEVCQAFENCAQAIDNQAAYFAPSMSAQQTHATAALAGA